MNTGLRARKVELLRGSIHCAHVRNWDIQLGRRFKILHIKYCRNFPDVQSMRVGTLAWSNFFSAAMPTHRFFGRHLFKLCAIALVRSNNVYKYV
jgi:hypothetical protein